LSTEQRENLEAALRRSRIPAGSSVSEQRRLPRERASARPAPADVTVTPTELGDAFQSTDLASQIGRRAQARVISTAPSDIAFAGDSAGGGLAVATMVNARDHGLPLPAATFLMSPYADLTLVRLAQKASAARVTA
jgi:epsilon-lactone hydrolase